MIDRGLMRQFAYRFRFQPQAVSVRFFLTPSGLHPVGELFSRLKVSLSHVFYFIDFKILFQAVNECSWG